MTRLQRMVAPETSVSGEVDGDKLYRLTADHIFLLQAKIQLLRRISSVCGLQIEATRGSKKTKQWYNYGQNVCFLYVFS